MDRSPRIVVTVAAPARDHSDPAQTEAINARYAEAIRRHGGVPVLLDAQASAAERRQALATMEGLLLSGGADIDPARYGAELAGSRTIDEARDELEAEAWAVAAERELPVLGICRGHQALNVFSGGRLVQHVEGHDRPAADLAPTSSGSRSTFVRDALGRLERQHELRLVPGTRLARILAPSSGTGRLIVNSSHHQAVRPADLAPGLVAAGVSWSPIGEIVEALEGVGERFLVGVQCHPERTETSPSAFDRLWRVFVGACRGAAEER